MVAVELDWPDVVWPARLPRGWHGGPHCSQVNSDGTVCRVRGGRLRSPLLSDIRQLADVSQELRRRLRPVLNHRASARVWFRHPALADPATRSAAAERVLWFSRTNLPGLWSRVDPLDPVCDGVPTHLYAQAAAYRDAEHGRRHRLAPAGPQPTGTRPEHHARELARDGVPAGRCGAPLWHRAALEAVNLRHVARGLIEFRCLAAPADAEEVAAAARFGVAWVSAALGKADALWAVNMAGPLPRQLRFDAELETAWRTGGGCG